MKELTIEEIKKELDAGREVELECIDSDSFIGASNGYSKTINKIILSSDLIVGDLFSKGVEICDCDYGIMFEELKYFRIKRPVPTFDDLIDVAVQAKKDGVLKEVAIATRDGFDCVVAIHEDNVSTLYASSEIKHHIEYIKSLYTETFVIKEFSDTKRLKSGANAVLGNGEEVIFSNRCGVDDALWFEYNDCHSTIIPFIALKGATVTQRKGSK